MKVPYRKDLLHSTIDWERFFAIQANTTKEKVRVDKKENVKQMKKSVYKGGRIR